MTSFALQYGVPLKFLVSKFSHARFEPSGWTGNPDVPYAKSLTDYLFRWLAARFLTPEERAEIGMQTEEDLESAALESSSGGSDGAKIELPGGERLAFTPQPDAPLCHVCGSLMVRSGICHKCMNCGATSGCS
jgi:ribonucleoside-diphosphate reductase alpha chain